MPYSTCWPLTPTNPTSQPQETTVGQLGPHSRTLHHYQLSLNSTDHHLNYPLSCPPDGFFANYNLVADGQGVMTAEAGAQRAW